MTMLARALGGVLAVWAAMAGGGAPVAAPRQHQGGYVIEFRSRPGEYFGHGYVVVGRSGRDGGIEPTRKAGFMPRPGASDKAAAGRVGGRVDFTAEDRRIAPDERYRVRISKAEHDRAVSRIDANKRRRPSFELFDQNCNTFLGSVAQSVGLRAPSNDVVLPRDYVRGLRALNGGG